MQKNDELKHFGVLGMRWGRRKGSSNSTGGRKLSLAKGADGRKVNKLFGKRNRQKLFKVLIFNKDWKKDMANDPLIKAGKKLLDNDKFKKLVYNHENTKKLMTNGREAVKEMFQGF